MPNVATPTLVVTLSPAPWAVDRGADDCAQALGGLDRLVAPGVGKDDPELVAAEATDDVGGAHPALDRAGDGNEQLVARAVAARVVDELEAVEVEDQQRAAGLVALGGGKLALELGGEAAAVVDAGQRVVVGEVLKLGLEALALGHVLGLDDGARSARPRRRAAARR